MRIAIVGTGISGLGCAYALHQALGSEVELTLFESESRPGGHTHTVDVTLDGVTHGVDTGFLVFNERTYPRLIALFEQLQVPVVASDMSFSARIDAANIEWSGSNLNTVFAQRSNLLRPSFLSMLKDILRFNKLTTAMAVRNSDSEMRVSVGDFLAEHGFGQTFRDWYFVPMIAAIWSCPESQMMRFPMGTMIRFCHNHGLLQVENRPRWFTVQGGARQYVHKILERIGAPRLGEPVLGIDRSHGLPRVRTARGTEIFDEVILACHSDQSLALLEQARPDESAVLGAVSYQPNRALLHTDASLLPRRKLAWAAWNYHSVVPSRVQANGSVSRATGARGREAALESASVGVHYLINKLQPLPFEQPVIVSLNPPQEPRTEQVLREIHYAHPVFDAAAVEAQRRLPKLQGEQHTWYCGAWTRYGFHEDGLMSGQLVAEALVKRVHERRAMAA